MKSAIIATLAVLAAACASTGPRNSTESKAQQWRDEVRSIGTAPLPGWTDEIVIDHGYKFCSAAAAVTNDSEMLFQVVVGSMDPYGIPTMIVFCDEQYERITPLLRG